ncbi:DUF3344 domain-containing protein [Streptomyces lasalocidi]|uniref:DUF3344 domain-containing protein n=1 Tax=Streptomyces lasalocidi TaxID=324833 RepID=A0A4U5WK40_STRLS|nr:DUF3344 domain-containing protein [Streptomyces lasalocidi]TKT00866.1 DUF3344 domain-containing protein [Streptomyces lasalocidi]
MRLLPGPLLRRATAGALALAALWAPTGARAAVPPPPAPAPPAAEAQRLPFTERHRATQHGGFVRAANTAISCRTADPGCAGVRDGRAGANDDFDMFYVDVDDDPNTYNSSRAELRLPPGSRVTYARLYWGGNLRVGEQKPAADAGRVLVAEPGGRYKAVRADTVVGHRVGYDADAFQASADVTGLVRDSGSGLYTVAQVDVAKGRSAAGAWGGWTLVAAYENPAEPLRHLALWDGFDTLAQGLGVRLDGRPVAPGASGRVGIVAYDGDRGRTGDSLTFSNGHPDRAPLSDAANPGDDVLNSTISEPGEAPAARVPAYAHTLGYDSDVFDLGPGSLRGGDQAALRLVSHRDAAWAGALFVAVDARK